MKPLTVQTIAEAIGAVMPAAAKTIRVTRICTDSRTLEAGDCFFALSGDNFDGHEYVAQAFAKGASCAVVSRDTASDGLLLRTDDTIKALGDLARAYRRVHPFKVVAITGSVGKTTTRQIVYHVLSRHFRTHQARKNFNNNIGLPLTLLDAKPDDEIVVAELGANAPGEIAYLTGIAGPDVAVVTNTHPAHLAGFGSLETIIQEKVSIAQGLNDNGAFFVNGDIDALVGACRDRGQAFRTFGRSATCDYRAEQVVHEGLTSTFRVNGRPMRIPLPGPGNVDNALAAWAVCEQFGLTLEQYADALEALPSVAMRAEPLQIGTLTVLNDCYNANPASMNNALAMLGNLRTIAGKEAVQPSLGNPPASPGQAQGPAPTPVVPAERRRVFVCGAMAELGQASEALHAELGQAVAKAGVDLLITVGEATKATAAAAKTGSHRLVSEHFDDTASLCDNLSALLREHDIILVKGSRTARLENVVQRLMKENQR